MNIRGSFISILIAFAAIAPGQQARAVTLTLDPSAQDVTVAGTATVHLNISDLGEFVPPSLGAFLVAITFDDSILSFDSVVYGPLLGSTDPLDFETDIITSVGPGIVSLDEISFLSDLELDALQPGRFTLAILEFTGIGAGTSTLGFGAIDLSDAAFPANSIVPVMTESGNVTVRAQAIPEPSPLLLVASGIALLLTAGGCPLLFRHGQRGPANRFGGTARDF